jgi:hypothetical protein
MSTPLQAEVVRVGGVLKIAINGEVFDPLAYRSYRPTAELVRDFAATGLRLANVTHTGMLCTLDVPYSLFGEVWTGPHQFDWQAFDAQMAMFEASAPGAYYNLALQLDTRDWYLAAHPECSSSYWNLVEMAGHEPWREDTAASLQDFLRQIEARYGDRVFAYSLLCGASTEWYTNSQGNGRPEARLRHHPLKEQAFRRWTEDPEAELPSLEQLYHTSHGDLRDPQADAAALRYWRFHHEIIGDTILYLLDKAQQVLQHRKLLGLFYGYLTQLDGRRLLEEGHLGYERVWRSPDLDMLYAPAKYGAPRQFDGASGYLLTVDSLDLRGKLVFQEIDHTTHVARRTVENGRVIPGSDTKFADAFATRHVLRREFALTRAKRTALWWFDFLGGNYASPETMAMVAEQVRVQERLRDVPMHSVAEIAVFGDVASMYHTAATSPLAIDLLVQPPDALARIGAPHDIYNLSDLDCEGIPWEQYKLVVFLNALRMPPAIREFVRTRLQSHGRSLLWMYAPNYLGENGFTVEGIGEVTGMRVVTRTEGDSCVVVPAAGPFERLAMEVRCGFSGDTSSLGGITNQQAVASSRVSPLFALADPAAEVWGSYVADGLPALASRRFAGHTSWYSAVGNLPTSLWREIARAAGVHIYSEGTDPLYINSRLIGVHMQGGQDLLLSLPFDSGQLEELFDGGRLPVTDGRCHLPADVGATKLYLLTDAALAP